MLLNPTLFSHRGLAIAAIALLAPCLIPAQELHLKTRTLRTVPRAQGQVADSAPDGNTGQHQILEFDHMPGTEDLAAIAAAGGQVTGSLPDNAVIVSGLRTNVAGVRWSGLFDVLDKLSPELYTGARVLDVVVEFHADVPRAAQDRLAADEGLVLARTQALLAAHATFSGSYDEILRLAGHDEVAYVFPAHPGLTGAEPGSDAELQACAGMLTLTGMVGQYANIVHGWDLGPDKFAHLGYVFGTLTTKVASTLVQQEVIRAFNEWAKNTNVVFQPGLGQAEAHSIYVRFASGSHGDGYPFDGPGGTLAHTFYPVPVNPESIAGDMHLDADENWHSGGDIDIYSVALHEAGHALGLGHSDKPGDVMYPYYRRNMALSVNDVGAVRQLYGAPAGNTPVVVGPPPAAPITPPPTAPVAPTAPLSLTLDAAPNNTQDTQATLTGIYSGGTGAVSVQWQTDRGYTGKVALSAKAWTAAGITLALGPNAISVTAFDETNHSVSKTIFVTRYAPPASGAVTGPVSIHISSPSRSVVATNAISLTVSGTATSGNGISRVTWQTAAGGSGVAKGTELWFIGGIPLLSGTNTILLRTYDNSGGSAWAALVVVKQ